MTNAQPGWFPDPTDGSKLRWWDGAQWSSRVSRDGATWIEALPIPKTVSSVRFPVWGWIAVAAVGLIVVLLIPALVPVISLTVLITGIVALVKKKPTWLRLKSKNVAVAVTVSAAAVLLVSSAVSANLSPPATQNDVVVGAVPFVNGGDADDSKPQPAQSPSSTPKPSPMPKTSTREESVTEPIAFERVTVEDPALARGTTQITTGGLDGEKTLTYRVTLSDGAEVSRELISETVTRAPVAEVTALGIYDAPPPPPPAPEASGCDPNYADACVPIASDVDCAGGSGNGPAYFDGVARVVGSDIYDLDRNGDGYACEQ